MHVFAKEPEVATDFKEGLGDTIGVGILSLSCLSVSHLALEGGMEGLEGDDEGHGFWD